MKSIKSIAAVIIERRNRMSHIIMPGDMQAMIGSDGVQEALRRGWIEPDYDTGALKVSSSLAIVEEIARIAECDCETCGKKECDCDCADVTENEQKCAVSDCENKATTTALISVNNSPKKRLPVCRVHADAAKEDQPKSKEESADPGPRNYALRHSTRLTEFAAPGSGQPERPVAPQAPQAQPSTASNREQDYVVGTDVVVAEEGKSYVGKVGKRNSDGTYELSFGATRPAINRRYRKEEMQQISQQDLQLVK